MNDPIGDMLTRIRNALLSRHRTVDVPTSKVVRRIADILAAEGYLEKVEDAKGEKFDVIRLTLKYGADRASVIQGLRRLSTPGSRKYVKAHDLPHVRFGLGTAIVSTSRGVMTDTEARKQHVGGELLCTVW